MRILSIRPEPPGFGNTIARFDVQITDDVRLFNLKLVDSQRGRRVYAPSAYGASVATFAPAFGDALISAAMAALGGEPANDVDRNAA